MALQIQDKYIIKTLQTQYLIMSSLTKHHLETIKDMLPHKYVKKLTEKVNEKLPPGKNVSESLVTLVMNGYKPDYHGIIETAIDWAAEIEKQVQKMLSSTENMSKTA